MSNKVKYGAVKVFKKAAELAQSAKDYLAKRREREQAQAQQIQQQMRQNQIMVVSNQVQAQMQQELFAVLSRNSYPYLKPVSLLTDIVLYPYRITQSGVLFDFALLIGNAGPALPMQLPQIKQKMDLDIAAFQQYLVATTPPAEAWLIHPLIMSGLWVVDIKRDGIFIIITVATR